MKSRAIHVGSSVTLNVYSNASLNNSQEVFGEFRKFFLSAPATGIKLANSRPPSMTPKTFTAVAFLPGK